MSNDFSDNDVQVAALFGASMADPVFGVPAGRTAQTAAAYRPNSPKAADSAAISRDAAEIAEYAKTSNAAMGQQEISWSSLESLQQAVRSNTLPIDSVALAHAILRDENFPQGS